MSEKQGRLSRVMNGGDAFPLQKKKPILAYWKTVVLFEKFEKEWEITYGYYCWHYSASSFYVTFFVGIQKCVSIGLYCIRRWRTKGRMSAGWGRMGCDTLLLVGN